MEGIRTNLGFLVLWIALSMPAVSRAQGDQENLGDARAGEQIYNGACVACHGRDGRGSVPGAPDFNLEDGVLARNKGLLTRSNRVLLTHILEGFGGRGETPEAVPKNGFEDLTIKDLRDVLTYLHEHFHYQTLAHAGERIYNQTCVACHGGNGKGTIPGAPDFTKERGVMFQSNAVLLDHILNGFQSAGSQMGMPAKGANEDLTTSDIKNVLDYLRQHFHYETYRSR